MEKPINCDGITGIILAGGKGSRLGGVDKGLYLWQTRPLIEHVLERIRPQCKQVVISANRHIDEYERYGFPVVRDRVYQDNGPLAGIYNAGQVATSPYILTVPCDAPTLPLDLAARLANALVSSSAKAAYAHDGVQSQHLYLLFARELLDSLGIYLESGQRKVMNWLRDSGAVATDFSDTPSAFFNINE